LVKQSLPCRWISAAKCHTECGQLASIHELVSQGRYSEALDQWEQAKEDGSAGPHIYSSVMQMAAQLGGSEVTRHVKEDMERQGWNMDRSCSLHYLGCLASEGHIREAVGCIQSSHLKNDPFFLAGCASMLLDKGYPQAALEVCALSPPSPPHPHTLTLLTMQLEAMGEIGRETEMELLVKSLYSEEEGELRVPQEVEFALANGYSLAGHPARALSLLKNTRSRCVPVKCLALLFESALRENEYTLAAEACSLFWTNSTVKPSDEAILSSPSSLSHHTTYHCRAITAAFYLQAHAHRDTGSDAKGLLAKFLERNFFQELVYNKYPTSPDIYQALLLLGCYHPLALSWADSAMKQCTATGQVIPAASLTSWARGCGIITPQQALRVINLIRAHRHYYQLDFNLCHYADLLSIRYQCDSLTLQKEALDCIRAVKNSMNTWGILNTTDAYNLILQAVIHVPVVGAHYTTYNDMIASHVDPNMKTFHLLLDGTLAEGSVKNTKKAAYYLWRSLMKEWPRVRPDLELINKFIRCCLVCGDSERGLVFLSALSDCSLEPDIHTFSMLLKLCHSTNDHQSFDNLLKLARHCLPDQRAEISAVVHELRIQWRAEEDIDLAHSILSLNLTSK
jgi:hypothetical protein